jgi:hypothetical protein
MVRLDFNLEKLGVLLTEFVGLNMFWKLPLGSSAGMEADSASALLLMLGVRTGIGRSIDNLEAMGRTMGTFSDSWIGLTGLSIEDPIECE